MVFEAGRVRKRLAGWAVLGIIAVAPLDPAAAAPSRVVVEEPRSERISRSERLTGTVVARRRAQLSARTSGLVEVMHVEAGDRVEKGAILMELDSVLAELRRSQAEEALAAARVQLEETKRLRDEGNELIRTGGIPATEFRARQASLLVQGAVAKRLQAEAREQAEVVERHDLPAPFSGVISEKMAEAGEWVETGDPVLELVAVDDLLLDVEAPQEMFAALRPESEVTVELDALPGKTFDATVEKLVPIKDPTARTFRARLRVHDTEGRMTPGMSAQALFRIEGDQESLLVPRDAVIRSPDGSTLVWIARPEGGGWTADPRPVRLGDAIGDDVMVLDGLEAREKVVIRGNEGLQEDAPLELLPSSQPPPEAY